MLASSPGLGVIILEADAYGVIKADKKMFTVSVTPPSPTVELCQFLAFLES